MEDHKSFIDTEGLSKHYAKVNVYDAKDEASYLAKRSSISFVTRRISTFIGSIVENSAEIIGTTINSIVGDVLEFVVGRELARNVGAVAGSIGGSVAGIMTMGLAAATSAGFAEMDYLHQKRNIRNLYRDEVGTRLNKPVNQVTVADMDAAAKENRVIDEELKRARRQRNFAVPLAAICTIVAFAVATFALPATAGFLLKAAVSMATYYAVKTPLQLLGNRQFGLMKETVNDRIFHLKLAKDKCQEITPEQVLGVFTKANTKLAGLIELQFGKPFEELDPQHREDAVRLAAVLVPIDQLAKDITEGKVKVTELAFASGGDISGVPRNEHAINYCNVPEQDIVKQVNANFTERFARSTKPASHTERLAQQSQHNDPTLAV